MKSSLSFIKLLYLAIAFIGVTFTAQAKPEESLVLVSDSAMVYDKVEQMPVFPEGEKALVKYMKAAYQAPESFAARGSGGTIIVQFVLNEQGKVRTKDAKILKTLGYGSDEPLIKALGNLPAFTPALVNNRAVPYRITYTIEIDSAGRITSLR
jgi:protein TonB